MTFTDLPTDWRLRALTDPTLTRDVVDLYSTAGDRSRGALTLIICDHHDHFKGAIAIDLRDLIPDPTPGQAVRHRSRRRHPTIAAPTAIAPTSARPINKAAALRPVIRPLQVYPGGSLVLALGRRGPSTTTVTDREWADAATRVCRSLGVRLLGFYLASRDTVFLADLTTEAADLPIAA
ncbi:hypothetical protein [Kribbella sp. NPDC051770]|uniref:hypothetical protein n=1 Tax=Kribbella sp. NPDC051770 TaxID=3155413 RepID=UPI0034376D3F